MAWKLAELLFRGYRRRVLLLLHADKRYHVREIARLTDNVAGTLHKELACLADAGLLLRETVANRGLYGANRDCPEINSKVYSKEKWNQMLKHKDAFTNEIPGKPKLFNAGSEDEPG